MHSNQPLSLLSRLTCISILSVISACGMAQVEEKKDTVNQPTSAREADKADRVAEILKRHEFHLNKKASGPVERHAFCELLFDKLKIASPEIEYPEPAVRTDDPKHPVFDKYQYCSSAEHVEKNKGGTGNFFYLREFGTKGFRVYRMDIDKDPAAEPEEIIYGEASKWLNAPYGGYHSIVVNPEQGCQYRAGVGVSISSKLLQDGQLVANESAIVSYSDNYFIYDLEEYSGQKKKNEKSEYWLSVIKLSRRVEEVKSRGSYCNWSTIPIN